MKNDIKIICHDNTLFLLGNSQDRTEIIVDLYHSHLKCYNEFNSPTSNIICNDEEISYDTKFINQCKNYYERNFQTNIISLPNPSSGSESDVSKDNIPEADSAGKNSLNVHNSNEEYETNALVPGNSENSNDGFSSGVSSETGTGDIQPKPDAISGRDLIYTISDDSGRYDSMPNKKDDTNEDWTTENSPVAQKQGTSTRGNENDAPENKQTESSSPSASSSRMTSPVLCCLVFVLLI